MDWIDELIRHMELKGYRTVDTNLERQEWWGQQVDQAADRTLYKMANSWYLGANIEGKKRVFMVYIGGFDAYTDICSDIAAPGTRGSSSRSDQAGCAPLRFGPAGYRGPRMREDLSADLALAAELGGEMGRRFSSFDWASHPLGPPQDWSPGQRVVVAMALTSRFPIVLWLGERLFLIYNDAYLPVLGRSTRPAWAVPGREVWGRAVGRHRADARRGHGVGRGHLVRRLDASQ